MSKPKLFTYTAYRLPNEEDLIDIDNCKLTSNEIIEGFGYTIVGRGMLGDKQKKDIIKSIQMLVDMFPTNKEYKKALETVKQKYNLKESKMALPIKNTKPQDPNNLSLKELIAADLPAPIQTETKGDGFIALPSSSCQAAKYDDATETLYIRFNTGVYEYFDVPEEIFQQLLKAKSIGSFFYHNIRKIYNYTLSKKYKMKGAKRVVKEDRYQEIFEVQKQIKGLLSQLKGEYVDDILTYNHLYDDVEDPNPQEYTGMMQAAKQDAKLLTQSGIKHKVMDGLDRNDIGLPYITLITDPHASAYMKESEIFETERLIKRLLPQLKGEYVDDILTYNHLYDDVEDPNPQEYTGMMVAAKQDAKLLTQNGIKHKVMDGLDRNDIGLPYITLITDPHASAYMKESEGEENDEEYKYEQIIIKLGQMIDEQVYHLYMNYSGDKTKLYPLIDAVQGLMEEEGDDELAIEASPEFEALCTAMNENNTLTEATESIVDPDITDEQETFYFTSSSKDILGVKGLEHPTAQGLAIEILSKFRKEFQSALDKADISQSFIMTLEFKDKEEMPNNTEEESEELSSDNPLKETKDLFPQQKEIPGVGEELYKQLKALIRWDDSVNIPESTKKKEIELLGKTASAALTAKGILDSEGQVNPINNKMDSETKSAIKWLIQHIG